MTANWISTGPSGLTLQGPALHVLDVIAGTADDDVIDGTAQADTISGLAGDDILSGRSGDDLLQGGVGDDLLSGGSGDDTLDGGGGPSTLMGGSGDDLLIIRHFLNDVIYGGSGFDTVSLAAFDRGVELHLGDSDAPVSEIEGIIGTDFADTVFGGRHRVLLEGGGGDDDLGGRGNSTLIGGAGDDVLGAAKNGHAQLSGGEGDDTIFAGLATTADGGAGDDTFHAQIRGAGAVLSGGSGSDDFTFVNEPRNIVGGTPDLITDLTNDDLIDLHLIDAELHHHGDQAFVLVAALDGHRGEAALSYDSHTDQTSLLLDGDGDGSADWTLLMTGDHTDFTNFVL